MSEQAYYHIKWFDQEDDSVVINMEDVMEIIDGIVLTVVGCG